MRCIVHDHTYASYRHLVALAIKYPVAWRLTYPCCEAGCADRVAHASSACSAELKCTTDAWPVDYDFKTELIQPEWIGKIQAWMLDYHDFVHQTRDVATGMTPIRELVCKNSDRTPDEIRALAALAFDLIVDDVALPEIEYTEKLPMALVDGPIPYAVKDVAAYVIDVVHCRPARLPVPPGFVECAKKEWKSYVKAEPGEQFVHRLPYGMFFYEGKNEGTYVKPAYRTTEISHSFVWRVRTREGVTYTDPETYVKAWIRERVRALDRAKYMRAEFMNKRNVFIRSVLVNKRFSNENGDMKREYLDEYKGQKKQRIARTFGTKHVDAFMSMPIGDFGPDFEDVDEEEDDPEEADPEGSPRKRPRRSPKTSTDLLLEDMKTKLSSSSQ